MSRPLESGYHSISADKDLKAGEQWLKSVSDELSNSKAVRSDEDERKRHIPSPDAWSSHHRSTRHRSEDEEDSGRRTERQGSSDDRLRKHRHHHRSHHSSGRPRDDVDRSSHHHHRHHHRSRHSASDRQNSKDQRSRDRQHRHLSTEAERDSRSSHKRRRESLSPDRDSGSEESEGEWVVAAPPPPPSALSRDAVSKSGSRNSTNGKHSTDEVAAYSDSDDSEIVGPTLPSSLKGRKGPTLPTVSDVQHQNSEIIDASLEEMRLARLRALEAAETNLAGAVDNLIAGGFNDPSAGPRDKKAEKRKMANEDRKAYIRALSPGGVDEVGDDELFDGSVGEGPKEKLSEIAQRRAEKERIKRERREAKFRERDAERRERWNEMKMKEEKTLAMLKELAKQRFGE